MKLLAIAGGSFAIILSLYEFAIRRSNLLRFLFGMKPRVEVSAVP